MRHLFFGLVSVNLSNKGFELRGIDFLYAVFNQFMFDANHNQLNAFEKGCAIVRWVKPTIIKMIGTDALDLLHRLTTKELLTVDVGSARRTVLTSNRGRVIDVFVVAHVIENTLLIISDSEDPARTISAIDFFTIIEDSELKDLSDSHTRISLVGPKTREIMASALGLNIDSDEVINLDYSGSQVTFSSDTSRGVSWVDVVLRSPEVGLVSALLSAGAVEADGDNFELFRISREIPGWDREYGDHANPIESGLYSLIDFDKGCYVGQEVIARLDTYDKVKRSVKVLESKLPLAKGSKLTSGSKLAGIVTSPSSLASLDGRYLSLALVRKAFCKTASVVDSQGISAVVR